MFLLSASIENVHTNINNPMRQMAIHGDWQACFSQGIGCRVFKCMSGFLAFEPASTSMQCLPSKSDENQQSSSIGQFDDPEV
jgi:hypothetical protein